MDRYKETDTYKYYNLNPKKLVSSGDCVVRAIATATNRTWEDVLMDLTEYGLERGYVLNDPNMYPKWLKEHGWKKHRQPTKSNGKRYTGVEFCRKFRPKLCIAHLGSQHIVCIIDGKVNDTWNSSHGIVGNYWTKGETE